MYAVSADTDYGADSRPAISHSNYPVTFAAVSSACVAAAVASAAASCLIKKL